MIILGVILFVLGWLLGVEVLRILGIVVLAIGLTLLLVGLVAPGVTGRRWYY